LDKIRILFTIPNFTTAGSGREMFNIIERLDKNIFEPWIAVSNPGGDLFYEIIKKNYHLLVQPFTAEDKHNIWEKLKAAKQIAHNFKQYKFDLWQSFNWSSDFTEALIARLSGAKYLYVKKNMNWDRKAWKIKSYLAKAIIARNKTMMESHFSNKYLRKKAVLITGGVNTEHFSPGYNSAVRHNYNIPDNAYLISCVAQIVRIKDQATVIKAIASLQNVYLILAGAVRDHDYANELIELVEKSKLQDRVKFLGPVTNVNELLNASNLFVLSTTNIGGHEEGCPVALLEAMATGVPCIATDVSGTRDIMTHGKTGLLFPPGNVHRLRDGIIKCMTERGYAKQMAEAALKNVQANHTLSIEAEAFSSIYQKIIR
jgi:glycosyltransferase involved in cell wall biosynthesis